MWSFAGRHDDRIFPTGPLTPMMRSMVISAHGHYGNTKTVDSAQHKFDDHVCGKAICNVDLRTAVSWYWESLTNLTIFGEILN